MPKWTENRIMMDSEGDGNEYGIRHKTHYERQMEAYEQAERGEKDE